MTEQLEQWMCIKFCLKLERSSAEIIQVSQKAAAKGNWWLAASSWQHTRSCITSHAGCFCETSNQPGDSAPYSPDFPLWNFWLLPKLNSPLKGKRFQTVNETQESTTVQLMVTGRTVWSPKVPTLKRTEVSLSYIQCFLYLVSSSINVSIFHITWLDTFWTDLVHSYIKLTIFKCTLQWH